MKRRRALTKGTAVALAACLCLCLCACTAHTASCTLVSAALTDTLSGDGLSLSFNGKAIVEVVIDITLAEKFTAVDAKLGEDAYRQQMFAAVLKGCTLTVGTREFTATYGCLPNSVLPYSAKDLTLFFFVPKDSALQDLTFSLDGSVLGDPSYQFSQVLGAA